MIFRLPMRAGLAGLAFAALGAAAFAQTPAPVEAAAAIDKGDTAFMFVAAALVLFMTMPGLALFYGGLVRSKNMLSVLSQVAAIAAIMIVIWVLYGYSLAFTDGAFNSIVGGFSKAFLAGVTADSMADTFTAGVKIPEYAFIAFQMTFAIITPALIVGGLVERTKFSAIVLFTILWSTFVYFPMAHMVWFTEGYLFKLGALDFAGGTVVHINAGVAALVGCLIVGKRVGYGKDLIAPHSLTMTMIGTAMLWVGWMGFNAGSNLEATGGAMLAMVNTFTATAGAGLGWLVIEWIVKGKPSLLGLLSGIIAGLVAVTPAAGTAGPIGAIVLGIIASIIAFFFCTTVKNALGYDDSLDVFGIHGVAGIIGSIGTGIFVAPALGGTGIADYAMGAQVYKQAVAVLIVVVWSGIGSLILFKIVDLTVGLRVTTDQEREGLDIAEHGERAYNN